MFGPAGLTPRIARGRPFGRPVSHSRNREPASGAPRRWAFASTTAPNNEKGHRKGGHFRCWWRWREYVRPCGPHPARCAGPALRPSGFAYRETVNPRAALRALGFASTTTPNNEKGHRKGGLFRCWWRWRELNPRPKALGARYYMLSSSLNLVRRQHDVRSAPEDQPVSFSQAPTGSGSQRSCDNDPTSTSTSTSGFGARP